MSGLRVGDFVGGAGCSGVGRVASVREERGKGAPFQSIAGPVVQAQHADATLRLPMCSLATAQACRCDSGTGGWSMQRVRGSGAPRRHTPLPLCPDVPLRADGTRACARWDWPASNSAETRRAGARACCRGAALDG